MAEQSNLLDRALVIGSESWCDNPGTAISLASELATDCNLAGYIGAADQLRAYALKVADAPCSADYHLASAVCQLDKHMDSELAHSCDIKYYYDLMGVDYD